MILMADAVLGCRSCKTPSYPIFGWMRKQGGGGTNQTLHLFFANQDQALNLHKAKAKDA